MTRAERAAEAARLRAEGLKLREVAERMGLSVSYAHALLKDPDGSLDRARKQSYGSPCVDCGKPTNGSNGAQGAADRCWSCNGNHTRRLHRRWLTESFEEWVDMFGVPPAVLDWSEAHARNAGQEWRTERAQGTGRPWPSPKSAQDHYGSWNAFIRAHGWDPFEVGHYGRDGEDPAVIAETARLYVEERLSTPQIAEQMGVTAGTVQYRLEKAGVPRRSVSEAVALRRAVA